MFERLQCQFQWRIETIPMLYDIVNANRKPRGSEPMRMRLLAKH